MLLPLSLSGATGQRLADALHSFFEKLGFFFPNVDLQFRAKGIHTKTCASKANASVLVEGTLSLLAQDAILAPRSPGRLFSFTRL